MKQISTLTLIACVALCGCAHFTTTQKDQRDANGITTITTHASATTFFSSRSDLAKFKATQTEKTQGAEVGSLSQQGATNTVAKLEALAKIAEALLK